MNQLKAVFPFLAALGVYFLASNSAMWKQMNQPHSVENEIKSIPVESFNKWSENVYSISLSCFFGFNYFLIFSLIKVAIFL